MENSKSSNGKGILDIDWQSGKATITKVTKKGEFVYDFFEVLEKYNGEEISFSISVKEEQSPIEE